MDIYCREFQGEKYKYLSSKKNLYNVVPQISSWSCPTKYLGNKH